MWTPFSANFLEKCLFHQFIKQPQETSALEYIISIYELKQKLQMSQYIPIQLAHQDKRLLNVLEIKIFDISQNIEIINKQLTINQIKDSMAQSFSIFNQLKNIFDKLGVKFLYDILKKMHINSVVLCSLLTEQLDKINGENIIKSEKVTKHINQQIIRQNVQENVTPRSKISKIGGVNLYNERYVRGLQYYQVADSESLELLAGRCRVKQSKKMKESLQKAVCSELEDKTDVQVESISEEIAKYINEYKQNSKIHNSISYEKQLEQIIDFFKTSEREAIDFLSKSPNNNNEYTEDYINRINDLETDIKLKEKEQKYTFLQKMNFIMIKLKEKGLQMQKKYQEKCKKLNDFEKSLKKETNQMSSQTYNGYESRLKQLQSIIRQHQQRYNILTEIKNNQINYESKYYQIKNQYQMKVNQNIKIKVNIRQLQEEADYLKKIIRDNKEKIISMKDLDKYKNNKKKILKSKKNIEEGKKQIHEEEEVTRKIKNEKKLRRYQKMGTFDSSAFRASYENSFYDTETGPNNNQALKHTDSRTSFSEIHQEKEKFVIKNMNKEEENVKKTKSIFSHSIREFQTQQKEQKQSNFKRGFKKTNEEQEKKVYFNQCENKEDFIKETLLQILDSPNSIQRQCNLEDLRSKISIQGYKNEGQFEESFRRSKKNILRQQLGSSIKSIEGNQCRPVSLASSKKIYFVSKEQKKRNKIESAIKIDRLDIVKNIVALTIYPHFFEQLSSRRARPSFPLRNEQKFRNTKQINERVIELKNKIKLNSKNNTSSNFIKSKDEKIYQIEKIAKPSKQRAPTQDKRSMKKIITDLKHLKSEQTKLLKSKQNTKEISFSGINKDKIKDELSKTFSDQSTGNYTQSLKNNTITNYILNQLQKGNLNLGQLKKIARLIDENPSEKLQNIANANNDKNRESSQRYTMKTSELNLPINRQDNYSQQNQGLIQNKLSINQKRSQSKQHKRQLSIKYNNRDKKQLLQNIFQQKQQQKLKISPELFRKIQQLHSQMAKCCKKGEICQHLSKYFNIIKLINDNNRRIGNCLKIHIEEIGINSSISQKPNKENITQLGSIDPYEQQKNRILPIINSTSNQFYKPKSKQYAYK